MNNKKSKVVLEWSFILGLFFVLSINAFADIRYVATNGNDATNDGTLGSPWRTVRYGIAHIKTGDTLLIQPGYYYERASTLIKITGYQDNIKIKGNGNVPADVVFSSSIHDFVNTNNGNWEIYDSAKKIYKSKFLYPDESLLRGYFKHGNTRYKLIPYRYYSHLESDNEFSISSGTDGPNVGPGIYYDESGSVGNGAGRIYIRMKKTSYMTITPLVDPNQLSISLASIKDYIKFLDNDGSTLENLVLRGYSCELRNGTRNFTAKNVYFEGRGFSIKGAAAGELPCYNLTWDSCRFYQYVPDWICWSDVKLGTRPARNIMISALAFDGTTHHGITMKNCEVYSSWDAIGMSETPAYNIRIHGNYFYKIRDDSLQLSSRTYDVRFFDNKIISSWGGPARHGDGDNPNPGLKYFYKNIIDVQKPSRFGRPCSDNSFLESWIAGPFNDGMKSGKGFASHNPGGVGADGDPWHIYNNTILTSGNAIGATLDGIPYLGMTKKQYVYNNIFCRDKLATFAPDGCYFDWHANTTDDSIIFDGNIYYWYRTQDDYFFYDIDGTNYWDLSALQNGTSWEDRGIQGNPQLDSKYRPAKGGIADSLGRNVSDWPGMTGVNYRGALPPN
jgi:hypothetical protein